MKQVKFAELHSPLFLNGKNFGLKLWSKAGLELSYDTKEKELLATYMGEIAHLPSTSVHCYVPGEVAKLEAVSKPVFVPKKKIQAQASTPMSHVFEGPGKGQG